MSTYKFEDPTLVLLGAFRYSLGRQTYMPSTIANEIRNNWKILSYSHRRLIQEEIKEAIEDDMAGGEIDIRTWESILALDLGKEEDY